jgi:hypothetical protein
MGVSFEDPPLELRMRSESSFDPVIDCFVHAASVPARFSRVGRDGDKIDLPDRGIPNV